MTVIVVKNTQRETLNVVDEGPQGPQGATGPAGPTGPAPGNDRDVLRTIDGSVVWREPDRVNVKDFGAVGDGTTDDTAAIQAVFDYARDNNGAEIYFPAGVYRVEAPVRPGAPNGYFTNSNVKWALNLNASNVRIYGDGADSVIKCHSTNHPSGIRLMLCRGSWKAGWNESLQTNRISKRPTYDMADASLGEMSVTLDDAGDASNFAVGDYVYLRCGQMTSVPNNNEPSAEINKIRAIDGAEITLYWPLSKDYADDGVYAHGIANIQNYVHENITIEDIAFDHQNGPGQCMTVFDGIVNFTFKPARSVVSGHFLGGREMRFGQYSVGVHFTGPSATWLANNGPDDYFIHWPFTWATGHTEVICEKCVASSEHGTVQFHVHEAVTKFKASNVILMNPPNAPTNQPAISVLDGHDGLFVGPTVINGGADTVAPIYVRNTTDQVGHGMILAPTVLGEFGINNPAPPSAISMASPNWTVRDPTIGPGKRVALNRPGDGNTAPQTKIVQEELSAFVDYDEAEVILGVIPADSYVRGVRVQVLTAFNAGTDNNLRLGNADVDTRYLAPTSVGSTGIKSVTPTSLGWSGNEHEIHAKVIMAGTAATAGRVLVTIEYSRSISQ